MNRPKADIHPTPKQFSLPATRFIKARYFDLKFWYKILWFCTVSHFFTTPPRGTQLSKTVSSPSPWFTVENCGRLAEAGTALTLGRGLYGSTPSLFLYFFYFFKKPPEMVYDLKNMFSHFQCCRTIDYQLFSKFYFFEICHFFPCPTPSKFFWKLFFKKSLKNI